jgi:hypothetical protein
MYLILCYTGESNYVNEICYINIVKCRTKINGKSFHCLLWPNRTAFLVQYVVGFHAKGQCRKAF